MLKLYVILAIIFGIVMGLVSQGGFPTLKEPQKHTESKCERPDKSLVFEKENTKRCINNFSNKGDQFQLSKESIKLRIHNMFSRHLKSMAKNPDEYNTLMQGDQVVKYNPKLSHFKRFNVKSFVHNNKLIKDYSLRKNKGIINEQTLVELACDQPKFYKVKSTENIKVLSIIESRKKKSRNMKKRKELKRVDFSAFQELEQEVGWYLYFIYNKNSIENFLLANTCNKSIALTLNHCIVDPSRDVQMEEIFWFEHAKRLGINIYCRNSNEKKWQLLISKFI